MKAIEWQISDIIEISDQVIYGTCWQMYFEYGQLSKKTILTQQLFDVWQRKVTLWKNSNFMTAYDIHNIW